MLRASELFLGDSPPHDCVCAAHTRVLRQAGEGKTLMPMVLSVLDAGVTLWVLPLLSLARQHEADLNSAVPYIGYNARGREHHRTTWPSAPRLSAFFEYVFVTYLMYLIP